MPAGGHRQPDGLVHSVHVADRPQPGHVVPTVADSKLRAVLPVQEVPADRHLRRGTQVGSQAPDAIVGPRGGRHLVLEAAAGKRLHVAINNQLRRAFKTSSDGRRKNDSFM